ncbi:MAG: hypothetical protein ACRDN0_20245 [Trebonia sp.]
MGYTPRHAKPASLRDAALSHSLFTINTPSVGRHAASGSTAEAADSRQPLGANPPKAA